MPFVLDYLEEHTWHIPERRLYCKILLLAIADFFEERGVNSNNETIRNLYPKGKRLNLGNRKHNGMTQSVETWIWGNNDRNSVLTFDWTCHTVDLDPDLIRTLLKKELRKELT